MSNVELRRMTSRELLVDVAGDVHAEHTVVQCSRVKGKEISFRCSCGVTCVVVATSENVASLALVPGEAS